jgi:hypothetical protein
MSQSSFSLEYIISIVIVMIIVGVIQKNAPNTSISIKLIVGLLVAYLTLFVLNFAIPQLNNIGKNITNYSRNSMYGTINNTGFIQMYPPLFAVLIIFLVMLYSGNI